MGGRDIGVVSMVLTLGWGCGCGFVGLVCYFANKYHHLAYNYSCVF